MGGGPMEFLGAEVLFLHEGDGYTDGVFESLSCPFLICKYFCRYVRVHHF